MRTVSLDCQRVALDARRAAWVLGRWGRGTREEAAQLVLARQQLDVLREIERAAHGWAPEAWGR